MPFPLESSFWETSVQLPDLLLTLGLPVRAAAENLGGTPEQFGLPAHDPGRMHIVQARQLGHSLLALQLRWSPI